MAHAKLSILVLFLGLLDLCLGSPAVAELLGKQQGLCPARAGRAEGSRGQSLLQHSQKSPLEKTAYDGGAAYSASVLGTDGEGGRFVSKSELKDLSMVACLEAKQRNPAILCETATLNTSSADAGHKHSWDTPTVATYPSYKDSVCNSHGEYFCDFSNELTGSEQEEVAALLKERREATPVQCGRLLNDPVDPRHYQPFYLGVVVIKDWPASSPEYLQQFGQILDAQWNMGSLFVGSPIPHARCPNTGVLFILTKSRHVYLSTASCEFMCTTKGGAEIATAVQYALDEGGAVAAMRVGIEGVYSFLGRPGVTSIGGSSSSSSSITDATANEIETGTSKYYADKTSNDTEFVIDVVIPRVILMMALVLMVSIGLATFFLLCAAPGAKQLELSLKRSNASV